MCTGFPSGRKGDVGQIYMAALRASLSQAFPTLLLAENASAFGHQDGSDPCQDAENHQYGEDSYGDKFGFQLSSSLLPILRKALQDCHRSIRYHIHNAANCQHVISFIISHPPFSFNCFSFSPLFFKKGMTFPWFSGTLYMLRVRPADSGTRLGAQREKTSLPGQALF